MYRLACKCRKKGKIWDAVPPLLQALRVYLRQCYLFVLCWLIWLPPCKFSMLCKCGTHVSCPRRSVWPLQNINSWEVFSIFPKPTESPMFRNMNITGLSCYTAACVFSKGCASSCSSWNFWETPSVSVDLSDLRNIYGHAHYNVIADLTRCWRHTFTRMLTSAPANESEPLPRATSHREKLPSGNDPHVGKRPSSWSIDYQAW